MLKLFALKDSRDEMGVGRVRDVFSDLLFPGTSVLHTRARYMLFVPWCEQVAGRGRVERAERTLVTVLGAMGATQGLIGRRSGPAVQTLPSTVYRAAMIRWGILDEAAADVDPERNDDGELAVRRTSRWHRDLPPAPDGFPRTVAGGFRLTYDEADWLRERILGSTSDSMLAHLLRHDDSPTAASRAAWDDRVCHGTDGELSRIFRHARLFSMVMHGALLVYNLLLAHRYREQGYTRVEDQVGHYEGRLGRWQDELGADPDLRSWDLDDFWSLVFGGNPRISPYIRDFVTRWVAMAAQGVHDDPAARELVRNREEYLKGKQSRFRNDDLLARWSGASGARRMTFRWDQTRGLVTDIRDGLGHAGAAT